MGNKLCPTSFYTACQAGNADLVNEILRKLLPADKEKLFFHRVEELPLTMTPMFTAIQHHRTTVVQVLLHHGCNPNIRLKSYTNSETALMHAVRWRDAAIVELLLKYGANINEFDNEKTRKTALYTACSLKDSEFQENSTSDEMVRLLLRHGANLSLLDKNDNLPLHAACSVGNTKVVELLLQDYSMIVRRQLDQPNKMAKTPLMLACEHNHVATVQVLLNHGANPFLALSVPVTLSPQAVVKESQASSNNGLRKKTGKKNSSGHKKTALCWAVENGHDGIVSLLLEHHRNMLTDTSAFTLSTLSSNAVNSESQTIQEIMQIPNTELQSQSEMKRQSSNLACVDDGSSAEESTSLLASYSISNSVAQIADSSSSKHSSSSQLKDFDNMDDDDSNSSIDGENDVSGIESHSASIVHLVGCCLLESILLQHVKIAEQLIQHAFFYDAVVRRNQLRAQQMILPNDFNVAHSTDGVTDASSIIDSNSSERNSVSKPTQVIEKSLQLSLYVQRMLYRALLIAIARKQRLMVQLLLQQLSTESISVSHLLLQFAVPEREQNTTETSHKNRLMQLNRTMEVLYARAEQDPVIVSLLQQFQ